MPQLSLPTEQLDLRAYARTSKFIGADVVEAFGGSVDDEEVFTMRLDEAGTTLLPLSERSGAGHGDDMLGSLTRSNPLGQRARGTDKSISSAVSVVRVFLFSLSRLLSRASR